MANLSNMSALTVVAKLKVPAFPASSAERMEILSAAHDTLGQNFQFRLNESGGVIGYLGDDPGTNSSYSILTPSPALPTDIFFVAGVTFSAGTMGAYANGQYTTTQSGTGTAPTSTFEHTDVRLGMFGGISGVNFGSRMLIGDIAWVRVYDRVLSVAEMNELRAGNEVASGLINYWNAEDIVGNSWPDRVGTAHGTTYPTIIGLSTPHQYWRVFVESSDSTDGIATNITELELRPTTGGLDQTGNGTASASTIYGATADADKAFDNILTGAGWASQDNYALPQWLQYDFGSAVSVGEIVMYSGDTESRAARMPRLFRLQYSDDGFKWTDHMVESPSVWAQGENRVFNNVLPEPLVNDPWAYGVYRINTHYQLMRISDGRTFAERTVTGNNDWALARMVPVPDTISGKYYFEVKILARTSAGGTAFGFCEASGEAVGGYAPLALMSGAELSAAGVGDTLMFAVDMATNQFWIGINGVWHNNADPSLGSGNTRNKGSTDVCFAMSSYYLDDRFSFAVSNANFEYPAPAGFTGMYDITLPLKTWDDTFNPTMYNVTEDVAVRSATSPLSHELIRAGTPVDITGKVVMWELHNVQGANNPGFMFIGATDTTSTDASVLQRSATVHAGAELNAYTGTHVDGDDYMVAVNADGKIGIGKNGTWAYTAIGSGWTTATFNVTELLPAISCYYENQSAKLVTKSSDFKYLPTAGVFGIGDLLETALWDEAYTTAVMRFGGRRVINVSGSFRNARSLSVANNQKVYWEIQNFRISTPEVSSQYANCVVGPMASSVTETSAMQGGLSHYWAALSSKFIKDGSDTLMFAVDGTTGEVWSGINGEWRNNSVPGVDTAEATDTGIIGVNFHAAVRWGDNGAAGSLADTADLCTYTPPAGFTPIGDL